MCDLVLSLSGKVFFPLLLTPIPQMSSTKLGVCFRFQSEKETGDRNYAIGYYLKEKKVTGRGRYKVPGNSVAGGRAMGAGDFG